MPLTDLKTVPNRTELIKLGTLDVSELPLTDQQKADIIDVLDIKYTPGGETRKDGFDCSGLVYWMTMCPVEKRDIPGTRPSATMIYNWAKQKNGKPLNDNRKMIDGRHPLVLATDKITPNCDMAHAVMVYGTVRRDDQKYYIVVQAGQARGIGNDDSTVSAYLVAEKRFFKTYGEFMMYYPRREKEHEKVAIRP